MKTTIALALVAGLMVTTGTQARDRTPEERIRETVDLYFRGSQFTQGYVLGIIRAIRNATRMGAYRICIPDNPTDGYVADRTMASLRDHHLRGTEIGTRWSPDLAIISVMVNLYPCRD